MIQLSISTQFNSFDPYRGPYQVFPLQTRVDLRAMAIKGYSTFPKAPALLEPRHQIVYFHIQETRWGRLRQRCNRCILQPQPTRQWVGWFEVFDIYPASHLVRFDTGHFIVEVVCMKWVSSATNSKWLDPVDILHFVVVGGLKRRAMNWALLSRYYMGQDFELNFT